MRKLTIFTGLLLALTASANAQVAQGGTYKLDQAVIASGGGTSAEATGSLYKLDGVIGEPVAGTTSSGAPYSVKGGFLSAAQVFVPTAAPVSIGGRVTTMNGGGLVNARVTLTAPDGTSRTILTRKSGTFRFNDLEAGEIYIISVNSRRYTFQPQVLSILEDLTELLFIAQEAATNF